MLYHLVIDGTPIGKERMLETPPDFTGHPTKAGWKWIPVSVRKAAPDLKTEVPTGFNASVIDGQLVKVERKRAKTEKDRVLERRAARDPLAEIEALETRVTLLEAAL